jgi:hypothetical protein
VGWPWLSTWLSGAAGALVAAFGVALVVSDQLDAAVSSLTLLTLDRAMLFAS